MQKDKKKVIIVFPDNWLSYSPTVINIAKLLCVKFSVEIITTDSEKYLSDTFQREEDVAVDFIQHSRAGSFIVNKLDLILLSVFTRILRIKLFNKPFVREVVIGYNARNFVNAIKFYYKLRKTYRSGDMIIAVDNVGMFSASLFNRRFYSVSLEIGRNLFHYFIRWYKIKSLIIQTPERRNYLLPKKYFDLPTYFVQNAPIWNKNGLNGRKINTNRMVYLGSLAIEYNCLDKIAESLYCLPDYFTLLLKGPFNPQFDAQFMERYRELIKSGRIAVDYSYISNDDLQNFLSQFAIGFTLYDLSNLPYRSFNVVSCPSGKLFNYYNSGLPVIGSREIIGLSSVSEYNAGILIDAISPQEIAKAIRLVSENFDTFSVNSMNAARNFDFEKCFNLFVENELTA